MIKKIFRRPRPGRRQLVDGKLVYMSEDDEREMREAYEGVITQKPPTPRIVEQARPLSAKDLRRQQIEIEIRRKQQLAEAQALQADKRRQARAAYEEEMLRRKAERWRHGLVDANGDGLEDERYEVWARHEGWGS